ncbi:MAG: ferric reductase-like transmembrane domain-containing protein [Aureliella sp.]
MNDAQFAKLLVSVNGAIPLCLLGWDAVRGQLGPNAVSHAIHTTGMLALVFLLLSLTITPLQKLTRWSFLIAARRPLGLYAFLYAVVHVGIYVALDRQLSLFSTLQEFASRRYLQIGLLAWLLMVPLAITSTDAMIRRLGSKRWKALHRLAYAVAIAAVAHYYLQVKADVRMPLVMAAVLSGLLLSRLLLRKAKRAKAVRIAQAGAVLCFIWQMAVAAPAAEPQPNVLDLPKIVAQQSLDMRRGVDLLRSGQRTEAAKLFQQCIERIPFDSVAYYNLACAQSLLDDPPAAIGSLQSAIRAGFRGRAALEKDPDLASLRNRAEFAEILRACSQPPLKESVGWKYSVEVANPKDGFVLVDSANMGWNAAGKFLQVLVACDGAGRDKPVAGQADAIGNQLNKWFAEGTAAGNVGDLYDNHDLQHSPLGPTLFPQLTKIQYGVDVHQRRMDNGVQRFFVFSRAKPPTKTTVDNQPEPPNHAETLADTPASTPAKAGSAEDVALSRAVVLGNSSTAVVGPVLWRSMPRLALTIAGGPDILVHQYLNNHVYVYPEHNDHDPGHQEGVGWGDVFFANTPYYVVSQGSSWSDQPFLQAFAATLAAMQPELKDKLRDSGLVAPTIQMLLRRCYGPVNSDEDYLSGVAHPTVFDGARLNVQRMVDMAHAMQAPEAPPLAMLTVVSEELGEVGRDYFDSLPNEVLLNSPCAIARLGSSTKFWREMTVSAAGSLDPNGRELSFHWVVLRGDPALVQLDEVEGDPTARRIRVGYHRRRRVEPQSAIESTRVDIGVFAHNGVYYSPPAFVSFYYPDNETREYDDQQRIVSVDYLSRGNFYADPAISVARDWRDEYHYDEQGQPSGWTRTRQDGTVEEFNARGQQLVPSDQPEAPPTPRDVLYIRIETLEGRRLLQPQLVPQ